MVHSTFVSLFSLGLSVYLIQWVKLSHRIPVYVAVFVTTLIGSITWLSYPFIVDAIQNEITGFWADMYMTLSLGCGLVIYYASARHFQDLSLRSFVVRERG